MPKNPIVLRGPRCLQADKLQATGCSWLFAVDHLEPTSVFCQVNMGINQSWDDGSAAKIDRIQIRSHSRFNLIRGTKGSYTTVSDVECFNYVRGTRIDMDTPIVEEIRGTMHLAANLLRLSRGFGSACGSQIADVLLRSTGLQIA